MAEEQSDSSTTKNSPAVSVSKVGRMVGALDEIERRVEHLREQASAMEQEKEDLLGALQMLADNRDLLMMNECEQISSFDADATWRQMGTQPPNIFFFA